MNLTASTQYTFAVVRDYIWFSLCPRRAYRQILPAVLISLAALFAAAAVTYFLTVIQIFLTLAIVLFGAAAILANITLLRPRKAYRVRHSRVDSPNTYHFHEQHFLLRSQLTVDEETEIYYNDLYRAYETDDYFFLFTMRRKGCVVGKRDFQSGTPDQLRERLAATLGNRFVPLTRPG